MKVTILTPGSELYSGEAISVKVPGTNGQFQILKNHAPIAAALGKGVVTIKKKDGTSLRYQIEKGFIDVLNNEVSLPVQGAKEL